MQSDRPRWRMVAAAVLFVVGLILPLLIPILFMIGFEGWLAGILAALFALGLPELLWLVAALLIGRDGFRRMRRGTSIRTRWWWRRMRGRS